jgi:hypothetical protein
LSANKLIGGKSDSGSWFDLGPCCRHNSDRSGGSSDFGDASQPWTATGEQSLLLTRIAATGKRFVVCADEKLTAFLELKSEILASLLPTKARKATV